MPSGGSKVIHHQQRIFRIKCQRFEGIGRRSEMTGEMRGVHRRPEMLLTDCGQGGLEYASLSREEHTEIDFSERRPVYRRQQREADSIVRERQAP